MAQGSTIATRPARKRAGLVVCGTWLLASFAATAQVRGSGDYLARMDADRDGRVALAEYQDWLSYAFDAMDRDRDGRLAPGELPGGRGREVTREEHRAKLAAAFARQDANTDGFLDARELAAPPR
jgi:hypothetical protein